MVTVNYKVLPKHEFSKSIPVNHINRTVMQQQNVLTKTEGILVIINTKPVHEHAGKIKGRRQQQRPA